jgi:hypothetical protein
MAGTKTTGRRLRVRSRRNLSTSKPLIRQPRQKRSKHPPHRAEAGRVRPRPLRPVKSPLLPASAAPARHLPTTAPRLARSQKDQPRLSRKPPASGAAKQLVMPRLSRCQPEQRPPASAPPRAPQGRNPSLLPQRLRRPAANRAKRPRAVQRSPSPTARPGVAASYRGRLTPCVEAQRLPSRTGLPSSQFDWDA